MDVEHRVVGLKHCPGLACSFLGSRHLVGANLERRSLKIDGKVEEVVQVCLLGPEYLEDTFHRRPGKHMKLCKLFELVSKNHRTRGVLELKPEELILHVLQIMATFVKLAGTGGTLGQVGEVH